jgi:hypothetical protein
MKQNIRLIIVENKILDIRHIIIVITTQIIQQTILRKISQIILQIIVVILMAIF